MPRILHLELFFFLHILRTPAASLNPLEAAKLGFLLQFPPHGQAQQLVIPGVLLPPRFSQQGTPSLSLLHGGEA